MSQESFKFTADNQSSNHVVVYPGERMAISLLNASTFTGTISLERSFDSGSSWQAVSTYTAIAEDDKQASVTSWYRLSATATITGSIQGIIRSSGRRLS